MSNPEALIGMWFVMDREIKGSNEVMTAKGVVKDYLEEGFYLCELWPLIPDEAIQQRNITSNYWVFPLKEMTEWPFCKTREDIDSRLSALTNDEAAVLKEVSISGAGRKFRDMDKETGH